MKRVFIGCVGVMLVAELVLWQAGLQLWGLLALTLMWGVNWPMMKLSLQEMPPLYFRASTMCLGAAWLFVYVRGQGERMWPRRDEWATIAWLGLPNVLGWHTLSIFGVQELASGRAAILGFTMPIFTVLLGAAFFGERITPRVRVAVICAALAIALLLEDGETADAAPAKAKPATQAAPVVAPVAQPSHSITFGASVIAPKR